MTRVTHYIGSVSYSSTGSSSEKEYPFTEDHANEAGGVLEPDGLGFELAQKLCDKWTRRGNHSDVRYRYRLRVEDQLKHLDSKRKQ